MRLLRIVLSSTLIFAAGTFALSTPAHAYMHARRGPTSSGLFKKRSAKSSVHSPGKQLGPRAMDSGRATEIQTALIKSGYLTGAPSGHWDSESEAAMQKLQGNNGWQTKLTPDSRALILLGLGPRQGQSLDSEKTASVSAIDQAGPNQMTGQAQTQSH